MEKNKYRILMPCEYYFPFDRGGAEWSVSYLARSLTHEGHCVEIFTPNYGAIRNESSANIHIYRFPFLIKLKKKYDLVTPFYHSNIIWWLSTAVFLLYRVFKFKPTHIHVQSKYFIPAAVLVAKITGTPIIVSVRDYILLCPLAYCLREDREYKMCSLTEVLKIDLEQYLRIYKRNFPYKIFAFIAVTRAWFVSKGLAYFLRYADHTSVISKKMQPIFHENGIHVSSVIYNSYNFEDKTKRSKTQNYLLYAGRLTEGKGIDLLVKAYSQTKGRNIPKLLIVGSGPLSSRITAAANSKIKLIGQQTHGEVVRLIASARAVLVPSVWEEPFGRIALESIAAGTPALVTDRGALPEIVVNGKTGIIVEPEVNAISRGIRQILKMEKSLRAQLQKEKSFLVHKFAQEPVQQQLQIYKKIYESLRVSSNR